MTTETTKTFSYNGNEPQVWDTSQINSEVTFELYGAPGGQGGDFGQSGGAGGYVTSTFSVEPYDELEIYVAEGGEDGSEGPDGDGGWGRVTGEDGGYNGGYTSGSGGGGGGLTTVTAPDGTDLLKAGGGSGGRHDWLGGADAGDGADAEVGGVLEYGDEGEIPGTGAANVGHDVEVIEGGGVGAGSWAPDNARVEVSYTSAPPQATAATTTATPGLTQSTSTTTATSGTTPAQLTGTPATVVPDTAAGATGTPTVADVTTVSVRRLITESATASVHTDTATLPTPASETAATPTGAPTDAVSAHTPAAVRGQSSAQSVPTSAGATIPPPAGMTTTAPVATDTQAVSALTSSVGSVGVDAGATVSTQPVQTPTPSSTTSTTSPSTQVDARGEPTPPSAVVPGTITAPQTFLAATGSGYETRLVHGDGSQTGLDIYDDQSIAVDGEFNFYVAYKKYSDRRLLSFAQDGTKRWEYTLESLAAEYHRIAVSESGDLWVYDANSNDRVYRFDKDTGALLEDTIDKEYYTTASTVDADGALYLTSESGLIQKLVPNGGVEYSVSASKPGAGLGEIVVGAGGEYLYVQTAGGTVEKRSTSDGSLLSSRQWDINTIESVDRDGNIYGTAAETYAKFDFDADTVVWETSSIDGNAIEDAFSIDYRPDLGPIVFSRLEPDQDIVRTHALSGGTTGGEIAAFAYNAIQGVIALEAFPDIGAHPAAWETPGDDVGLQAAKTDGVTQTLVASPTTASVTSAVETTADTQPQTAGGSVLIAPRVTQPTPAGVPTAPALTTHTTPSPGDTAQASGAPTLGAPTASVAPTAAPVATDATTQPSAGFASAIPGTVHPIGATTQQSPGVTRLGAPVAEPTQHTPTVSTASAVSHTAPGVVSSPVGETQQHTGGVRKGVLAGVAPIGVDAVLRIPELFPNTNRARTITIAATVRAPSTEARASPSSSPPATAATPTVGSGETKTEALGAVSESAIRARAPSVVTTARSASVRPSIVAPLRSAAIHTTATPTGALLSDTTALFAPTVGARGTAQSSPVRPRGDTTRPNSSTAVTVAAPVYRALATPRVPFRFEPRLSAPTATGNRLQTTDATTSAPLGTRRNRLDVDLQTTETTLEFSANEIDVDAERADDSNP